MILHEINAAGLSCRSAASKQISKNHRAAVHDFFCLNRTTRAELFYCSETTLNCSPKTGNPLLYYYYLLSGRNHQPCLLTSKAEHVQFFRLHYSLSCMLFERCCRLHVVCLGLSFWEDINRSRHNRIKSTGFFLDPKWNPGLWQTGDIKGKPTSPGWTMRLVKSGQTLKKKAANISKKIRKENKLLALSSAS